MTADSAAFAAQKAPDSHSPTVNSPVEVSSTPMLDEYLQPLSPYLAMVDLTEVSINRPGEIWTESGEGWRRHDAPKVTFRHCLHLATLIATANSKKITKDNPILSADLPGGERVQVVIPPACERGTVSITIRKPSYADKTLGELESHGAFAEVRAVSDDLHEFEHQLLRLKRELRVREFLELAVLSKRNILIVGKTGSGKTTMTKSLIQHIPIAERLVTIEDVHELFMRDVPNKVHLFYARDDEGGSRVTPKQALASCLRMKPDRILLAELRGDEAWEFIKSVNTGHPGSISTMHANGAYEAFEQLTAFIKDSKTGAHLDTAYIRHRLFTTIDVVLYFDRWKLREIYFDPETKRKQLG